MCPIIIFLSVGLFNLFQDPEKIKSKDNQVAFSKFLEEVDAGRVVEVDIQGNNISGILSDGNIFSTFSPNYPNLVEKLSENFLFNASESASALNLIKFSLSFKLSNLEILNSFKFFLSFNEYVSPEMALIVEFKACLNCSFIRSSLFIKPEYLS